MRLVEIAEIKNIADYELERESWRPRIMALKDRRRIQVGGHMTFLFENRETVRYQVQEMMRIERIVKPQDIAHELETYNELIPGANELSASLLIEYISQEERQIRLRELLGLEQHVWLQVEGTAPRVPARFDTRQIATDRISSVQYIRFPLLETHVRNWGKGVVLAIDHPHYKAERRLTGEELRELAKDFE
jgi:Protein of unknown function (DUF3501)